MPRPMRRRDLLAAAARGGAVLSLADLSLIASLPRVSADEARLDPRVVRLDSNIEPLVRLLERTPRERLLEVVAERIHGGLAYREVLAALLLAGVRNVEPRPTVGFKFHAVLVVNSAHLASFSSPEEHRWLPIFWALDYFKTSQARDEMEGDWTMGPVDESAVPPSHRARKALIEALENWDEAATDPAAAGFARTATPQDVLELFARYGARDFRDIGHKAIFVANAWRTLRHIGWHHAEPVIRSLAYALVRHEGDNPAHRDAPADRPWRHNTGIAADIRADWPDGNSSPEAERELLATLRDGSSERAAEHVVRLLNAGVSPESIWSGLLAGSGELLVRAPGIVTLHAVTTTNAMHYAFQTVRDDETRRLLMLQNASFLPLFRSGRRQGNTQNVRLDELEPQPSEGDVPLDEIFADISRDRLQAARKVLAWAGNNPDPRPFIDAARLLVFAKGDNSHDYKFSSAVMEDCYHLPPEWQARFLAASVFSLRGSLDPDNTLIARARAALAG